MKKVVKRQNAIVEKKIAGKKALKQLRIFWKKNQMEGQSFVNFETTFLTMNKDSRKEIKEGPLVRLVTTACVIWRLYISDYFYRAFS